MAHTTGLAETSRERFMQAAREEMTKFERQEARLRKEEREERAKRLQLPFEKYDRP
jgi:hypothetical protein